MRLAFALVLATLLAPREATARPVSTPQQAPQTTRQAPQASGAEKNPTARSVVDRDRLHRLPGARDLWAVLEHWIPTVITDRLDVGGSATGRQALFSAHGTSFDQNTFRLDGIDVTDPAIRGTSGFFFDYDALQEIDVSWGTQPAWSDSPGVVVDLVIRSAANEVHGSAQGYFEHSALQADNIGDDLLARGLQRGASIGYLSDVSFQLGGAIAHDRAWLFGSYRDWRVSRSIPGFLETVRQDLPVLTVKATARPAGDRLSIFWSRQRFKNPFRTAGRFVAPEATLEENGKTNVVAGTWSRGLGGDLGQLELRASFLDIDFPLALQSGAARQSQLDIVTGTRTGSAPLAILSSRRRYGGGGHFSFLAGSAESHAVRAGADFRFAPTGSAFRSIDDVIIVTSGSAPLLAQLLNTPVNSEQTSRAIGVYAHDDWSAGQRWSLSLGLRYDDWSGGLPSQASPAGTYAPARQFGDRSDVIGWRSLAPRIAFVVDLFGDGRTHLVGGFAQYVHQLANSTVDFGNPNSLGVTTVAWSDVNGDGQFQPGEGGPAMTVSGGPVGQTDPDLSAPLSREFRLGLEQRLGEHWRGSVDLWYRKDEELFDDVEVGLDPDDFAPVDVLDPGRDNIPGTDDDRGLNVLNQVENFGGNALLLQTVTDKTVTYRGLDIGLRRRFADNWELSASLTLGLTEGLSPKSGLLPGDAGGISDLFNDPNALINADGRLFWDRTYALKVYAAYLLPHDIYVGGVLRSWSGAPQPRILPVALNQGIVNVYAEPRGALRLGTLSTADVRVAKDLDLSGDARLALIFDVFNITNASTVTAENDTNPNFGVPVSVVSPLVTRIGARVVF